MRTPAYTSSSFPFAYIVLYSELLSGGGLLGGDESDVFKLWNESGFFMKIAAFCAYRGRFSIFIHSIVPKGSFFSSVLHVFPPKSPVLAALGRNEAHTFHLPSEIPGTFLVCKSGRGQFGQCASEESECCELWWLQHP